MELLPSEFEEMARAGGLSESRIAELLGKELYGVGVADDTEWSARALPDAKSLTTHWQALAKDSGELLFRIVKRRAVWQSYRMAGERQGPITLLGTSPHHTIRFEAFDDYQSFQAFATRGLGGYPAMDFQNTSIRHLSADAFRTLTLLIELFVEKYPEPEADWQPDEPLLFTAGSLDLILADSRSRSYEYTWYQHWKALSGMQDPSLKDLEQGIAELAHLELVGYMEEVEGQDVYYIGPQLTWYIRGIAWWDKGFAVRDAEKDTEFIVFGASALFALVSEGNNDYSLFNLDTASMEAYLEKFISIVWQGGGTSRASSASRFCTQCGNELDANDRFCSKCGHRVQ